MDTYVYKRVGRIEIKVDAIKAFCDDKIAHYKIPQQISFVDDFPMTVTGKVQKYKMREKQVRIMAES